MRNNGLTAVPTDDTIAITDAKANMVAFECAKLASASAILIAGAGSAASPVLAPIAAGAGLLYALAVAGDWFATGTFAPFPILRTNPVEAVGGRRDTSTDWLLSYFSRPGLMSGIEYVLQLPSEEIVGEAIALPPGQDALPPPKEPDPRPEVTEKRSPMPAAPQDKPAPPAVQPSPAGSGPIRSEVPVQVVPSPAPTPTPPPAQPVAPPVPVTPPPAPTPVTAPPPAQPATRGTGKRSLVEGQPVYGLAHVFEAQNPETTVLLGLAGSGKGLTLSHLVKEIRKRYPDAYLQGIDPKADPKESDLWESGFDRVGRKALGQSVSSALDLATEAQWVFSEVLAYQDHVRRLRAVGSNAPCFLIWDELMKCTGLIKTSKGVPLYDDKGKPVPGQWEIQPGSDMLGVLGFIITTMITDGSSGRSWLIGASQSPNLEALPVQGSVLSTMRVVALARPKDVSLVNKLVQTRQISVDTAGQSFCDAAAALSPVGRAYLVSGKWYPAGLLPVGSYNRDKANEW